MELADSTLKYTPFPTAFKQVKGSVGNIETEATSTYFADQILITISQHGCLSQWIEVPISSSVAASFTKLGAQYTQFPSGNGDDEMELPESHLTPKTLLGSGGEQRENIAHLFAMNIASSIVKKNPEECRTILVGLGLEKVVLQREDFFDMMELLHVII
ncbi:hypothetical protein HI914_00461 [Erysiphe necator]|nr:hypothetical protein HI914_00461 [Erysiphe necator]